MAFPEGNELVGIHIFVKNILVNQTAESDTLFATDYHRTVMHVQVRILTK